MAQPIARSWIERGEAAFPPLLAAIFAVSVGAAAQWAAMASEIDDISRAAGMAALGLAILITIGWPPHRDRTHLAGVAQQSCRIVAAWRLDAEGT